MIKGNLKYPTFPILINTASVNTFNSYVDQVDGEYKILFPQNGMIMGGTNTTRTLNLSKTYAGSKQLQEITLNPAFPADTLNYETGFNIKVKHRDPGVYNDHFYPEMYHVSAKLPSVVTTETGYLHAGDVAKVKKALWDSGKLSATEGAFEMWLSTPETSTVTVANITVITLNFTDGTTAASGTLTNDNSTSLDEINADSILVRYGVTALLTATNKLKFIIKGTTNTLYSNKCVDFISFTLSSSTLASVYTNLLVVSTDPMKQAFVEVESDLGTVSAFSYAKIKQSSTGYSGIFIKVIKDSDNTAKTYWGTSSNTLDQEFAAVNSAINDTTYAYAGKYDADEYVIYSPCTLFIDQYPYTTTKGSITELYSGVGIYPRLTGDDIWRIFTNNAHDGEFANQHYVEKPDTSSEYILMELTSNMNSGGQHVASGFSSYQQQIKCYVKASEFFNKVYETQSISNHDLFVAGTSNSICSILDEYVDQSKLTASGLTATILGLQEYQ